MRGGYMRARTKHRGAGTARKHKWAGTAGQTRQGGHGQGCLVAGSSWGQGLGGRCFGRELHETNASRFAISVNHTGLILAPRCALTLSYTHTTTALLHTSRALTAHK